MKRIMVIHGPNLNMSGIRDKNVYGTITLDEINAGIEIEAEKHGIATEFFQSNSEGGIIGCIHSSCLESIDGIIINPGAFAHYSIAIRDALVCAAVPTIEVHMSNIFAREEFRQVNVISPVCKGQIVGFGSYGYILALYGLIREFGRH